MKNTTLTFAFLLALIFTVSSFAWQATKSKWTAPETALAVKNPYKDDPATLIDGKKIYDNNCAICHGLKGKGDGVAASGLARPPADHTSPAIQAVSDGGLFWMITTGNTPMPSYKTIYSEKQRWLLVNYIRTFAKSTKK